MDAGAAEGLRREISAITRQTVRNLATALVIMGVGLAFVFLGMSSGLPEWLVFAAVLPPALLVWFAVLHHDAGRSRARLHEAARRLEDIFVTEWKRGSPLLPATFRIPFWYRAQGGYYTMRAPPRLSRLRLRGLRMVRAPWRRWMLPALPALAIGSLVLGLLARWPWGVVVCAAPIVGWLVSMWSLEWAEGMLVQFWEYERITRRRVLPADLQRKVTES